MNLVSIIVPVYNNDLFIKPCLDSLINQTYSNIEIIIVNDGSTDNSLTVCEEYQKKDSRIKVKSITNSGVSNARNLGLSMSTGDYIMFVDSDDWIEVNTVENIYIALKEKKADIIIWSYYKDFVDKTEKKSLIPGGSREIITDKEKSVLYLKSIYSKYGAEGNFSDVSVGTVMCKMYRRELIMQNDIKFNPKLIRSEDVVFALHAFFHAKKIVYLDKNLYHYRMNNESMCAAYRFIENTREPFDLLIEELIKFKKKIPNIDDYEEVLHGRTIQTLLWHLKYNYYHGENPMSKREVKKEINSLIEHKYYREALKSINLESIPKQEKLMVRLFNKKMIYSHMFIQKIIEIRNKRKNNNF